jgi:hypothetical protein
VDLLRSLPRTYEVERVDMLQNLSDYREKGVNHLGTVYQAFGVGGPNPVGWKQRLYYQYWRLGRDDEVELQIIQNRQRLIERARLLAEGHPVETLPPELAEDRRSRVQRWFDGWAAPAKGWAPVFGYSQAAGYGRTLIEAARREAQLRLARVALALERFRIANDKLPESLEELVPQTLEAVPVDPFDGRAMQYEPEPGASFALSFRTVNAPMRALVDGALLWPVSQPPWPFVESTNDRHHRTDEVLPLVQFDEAPLFDVIKTLAGQEGTSLIIDPQIKKHLYPPVSLRLENVTSRSVLDAVLRNNLLRLENHPNGLYYVTFE